MGLVFVKKAYDDMQSSANVVTNISPDKFALRAFNHLAYDREISGPLVASHLFGLPNHYTLSDNVKSINLTILRKRFPEFALYIYKIRSTIDDLLRLWHQTSAPPTMFDHYRCHGSRLQNFCLFVYMRVIGIYPRKLAISSNIEFDFSHPKYYFQVQ